MLTAVALAVEGACVEVVLATMDVLGVKVEATIQRMVDAAASHLAEEAVWRLEVAVSLKLLDPRPT